MVARRIWSFFSSVKLAVLVILSMAAAMTAGTFVESAYDTPTAQYFVYRSPWFRGVLVLLGVNILVSALSRWPWRGRHAPFLLAHAGILLMLFGSWLTDRRGLDGMLRLAEGETGAVVEMSDASLVVIERESIRRIPLPWRPPGVAFSPLSLKDYGLPYDVTVDQFLSRADPEFAFVPSDGASPARDARPALRLQVSGGPMRIKQDFWLWADDPNWGAVQAGPARLLMGAGMALPSADGRPALLVTPLANGGLEYTARSSTGKVVKGALAAGKIAGHVLDPDWKGVALKFQEWIPDAVARTTYKPARVQYGQMAPPSAIHVRAGAGGPGAEIWLGLGDRTALTLGTGELQLGYFPQRVTLPYSLRLDRFQIDHYEGTRNPSEYSSRVTVVDGPDQFPRLISMNEPLEHQGITVYQSSYEEGDPRPVVSIFSVNQDPGRWWKYVGSILIVGGSILLFVMRSWNARRRSAA